MSSLNPFERPTPTVIERRFRRVWLGLIVAAVFCAVAAVAAQAQQPCAPMDQIAAVLAAEYQETRVQQGIVGQGVAMLAIFASPNGETWTAVMVRPDGTGCQVADGTDWQHRSDPAPVTEEGL